MRLQWIAVIAVVLAMSIVPAAQTRRRAPRTPAPATKKEAAAVSCPTPLGTGASTKRSFCDVLIGRDPATGILIALPPHRGNVTITFNLHNRHLFSQEQMRDKRTAYARLTASIGTLTMDNTLLERSAVQSEFRGPADFFDRITGGAGPTGLKAVGPIGDQPISVTIPEREMQVSILGEKLLIERADGPRNVTAPGSAIAIVSNLMVEYRPAPAPRAPARRR
jgi:hypothetical protein